MRGKTVQFFTNMVLEVDARGQVRPWPLGKRYRQPGKPYIPVQKSLTGCQTIGQYRVCYPFLAVYKKYGGEAVFGKPVAEMETNDLQIFQDFENVRMVYATQHPEHVSFAPLGRKALAQAHLPITPRAPNAPSQGQPRLKASFETPEVSPGETLTVTLVLVDGKFRPVAGQKILVVLRDGQDKVLATAQVGPTSKDGVVRFRWQVPRDYAGNEIFLEASTVYQGFRLTDRRLIRVLHP